MADSTPIPDLRYPATTKIILIVGCVLVLLMAIIVVGGFVLLTIRSPTPEGMKALEAMAYMFIGFLIGGFMTFVREILVGTGK